MMDSGIREKPCATCGGQVEWWWIWDAHDPQPYSGENCLTDRGHEVGESKQEEGDSGRGRG